MVNNIATQMRMDNKAKQIGYSLFELLIVLAFLGVLITFAIQFSANQQRQARMQLFISELSDLKNAVYAAKDLLSTELSVSNLIVSDLYFGEENSPWGEPYLIEQNDQGVFVRGYARTPQLAELAVNKLAAADAEQNWVKVFVYRPMPLPDEEHYLHREFDEQRPYLNQMNTALDMNANDIINVGSLDAQQANFLTSSANTAWFNSLMTENATIETLATNILNSESALINVMDSNILDVSELVVAQLFAENLQVATPNVTVQVLQVNDLQGDNLTTTQLSVVNQVSVDGILYANHGEIDSTSTNHFVAQNGNVQALTSQSLNANSLSTNTFATDQFDANQMQILGSLQVSELTAASIFAFDFVTGSGSLNAIIQQAAAFDSLWQDCVASGGCQ